MAEKAEKTRRSGSRKASNGHVYNNDRSNDADRQDDSAYTAYRALIANISDALTDDNITQLEFIYGLPTDERPSASKLSKAITLLTRLEKTGKIGPRKIASLKKVLSQINREDLNNSIVGPFLRKPMSKSSEDLLESNESNHTRRHSLNSEEFFQSRQLRQDLVLSREKSNTHPTTQKESKRMSQAMLETSSISSASSSVKLYLAGRKMYTHSESGVESVGSQSSSVRLRHQEDQSSSVCDEDVPLGSEATNYVQLRHQLKTNQESPTLTGSLSSKVHSSDTWRVAAQDENLSSAAIGSSTITDLEQKTDDHDSQSSGSPDTFPTPKLPKRTESRGSKVPDIGTTSGLGVKLRSLIRPSRPRSGSIKEIIWPVKRNKLNEIISGQKESKSVQSTKKIELNFLHETGTAVKLKLTFSVYPYGLDNDRGQYATIRIDIDTSKRGPKLRDDAMVVVQVAVIDKVVLSELEKHISVFTRESYMYTVISHQHLRESTSAETIEFKCKAKLS